MKYLFDAMGFEKIFRRLDFSNLTKDSVTASGNLINKLKDASLIEEV